MRDWSDEPWRKVYTRDSPDWTMLSFDAQAVMLMLIRKVNPAGILSFSPKHGTKAIAMLLGHPGHADRIRAALEELHADGSVVLAADHLALPKFLEAQEARTNDRTRQEMHRERQRALEQALKSTELDGSERSVTKRDSVSQNVTAASQNVTKSHIRSHDVTIRSEEIRSEEIRKEDLRDEAAGNGAQVFELIPDQASQKSRKPKRARTPSAQEELYALLSERRRTVLTEQDAFLEDVTWPAQRQNKQLRGQILEHFNSENEDDRRLLAEAFDIFLAEPYPREKLDVPCPIGFFVAQYAKYVGKALKARDEEAARA